MKNTLLITALSFGICCSAPMAFCQDTSKINHVSTEEDGDVSQKPVKKKPFKYHAQIGFEAGPNVGYFLNAGGSAQLGWCAGVVAFVPLTGRLYFQPGLYYSDYGGEMINSGFTITDVVWQVHSIEIPLLLGLWLGKPRHSYYGSYIGIGGFVAYNLGGTSTNSGIFNGTNGSGTLDVGSGSGEVPPLNYGLELNLGVAWRSGFFYSVKFKYGLADLSNADNGGMNTLNYGLTIGWLFGNKGKMRNHMPHTEHSIESKL